MSRSTIPMSRTTTCAVRVNNVTAVGRSSSRFMVKAVATSSGRAGSCSKQKQSSRNKDYYEVLSLEHSAAVGAEEIKRAYRRLALRYHPDLCPPSRRAESTVLFVELRRAYETLSDPARRLRYDAELRTTGGGKAASPDVELFPFPRDVWEAQLRALHERSERRQRARNAGFCRSD
ncbi:hypothetical protein QOZ80_6AG0533500 [Eleusine coracana subsp. coracana]|nr:hypothetical protein QOZ80_6BG0486530 [Eleusine coracana subsp. coracana]KAK3133186.1 hypothetical protein QOZ80_6AG0533500 [Eleusine coracana subsp. coracana]